MKLITDEYRELNRQMHSQAEDYGVCGSIYGEVIFDLKNSTQSQTVLDYGCGKRTLAASVPFPVEGYDPCIEGLDAPPKAADLVVCTDVLEHIEPELLDNVLMHIASLTNKVAFLTVSIEPALKLLPDGRNSHLIVQPIEWWRKRIECYFEVIEMQYGKNIIFAFVTPRSYA